ncbi:MAG: protein kinase domain-containing protein [Bacteroidota bacterium]
MVGQTISHYKILEKLGEGGMGVVYKAQDTKLDRLVALKFLPSHLSTSEQDKARFIQEAKAASAINHPNICTIYSVDEHDKQLFIAMEFVDGQTLREKFKSQPPHQKDGGQANLKSAIDIGIQIADGLAAAHEKGIVHRDIKPENIMVRKDGIAQIMDFGLAKLQGISRLTKEGSTVGTAGYMSPEQVQGQDADHRSDIFSLGVLLYEMITGQLPFKGVHETAMAYEIVNVDSPPMSSINPEIPPELDAIVLECLEKDPKERTQAASQVSLDLKRYKRESSRQRASRIVPARPVDSTRATVRSQSQTGILPRSPKMKPLWLAGAVVLGIAIGWLLFLQLSNNRVEKETRRVNLSATTATGQKIYSSDIPAVAISPDGQFVAYSLTESGSSRIFLRALNNFQSTPIKGTENGTAPFFSPDGQWIAFAADGKIKKVPASGGSVETICEAPGFRGASWGPDNKIIFSPEFASSLMSVSAGGGSVQVFSKLDSAGKERTHRWPSILPDGKWVLYTIGDPNNPNSYADALLAIQSTETGERHILDVRGEMAQYVEPGYLIVARSGALLAAPFSLKEFRVTQPLSTVMNDVSGDPGSGVCYFSVSTNGHLVYLPGYLNQDFELVSVTREGQMTTLPLQPQPYTTPRVSPDGSKLAVTIGLVAGNDTDIWIYDFQTTSFNRLTFEKRMFSGIWSRDGKSLYYASGMAGKEGLMVKPADGSSNGTIVLPSSGPEFPISISPDGGKMIINTIALEGDIHVLDLNIDKKVSPLISSPASEYGGHISPDGKYIIYISNESGRFEVYVRTYPDLKGKWQISKSGGVLPLWSPDGREILYVNTVGRMMTAPLQRQPTFLPGAPRELFDASQMYFPNNPIANYDMTPDGKNFIFVRSTNVNANVTAFNVVLNWTDELTHQLSVK